MTTPIPLTIHLTRDADGSLRGTISDDQERQVDVWGWRKQPSGVVTCLASAEWEALVQSMVARSRAI